MNTIRLLQLVVLVFGEKELCNAIAYHKQQKRNGQSPLCVWVFLLVLVQSFQ